MLRLPWSACMQREIGLDLDMIIITVGRLLVAHSIPFMFFLWYQGTHSFRPKLFLVNRMETISLSARAVVCASICNSIPVIITVSTRFTQLSPSLTNAAIITDIASSTAVYDKGTDKGNGGVLNRFVHKQEAKKRRTFHRTDINAVAVVLAVVGRCHMFLGTSWSFLFFTATPPGSTVIAINIHTRDPGVSELLSCCWPNWAGSSKKPN